MSEEKKPFEYLELKAMCMLCVAYTSVMMTSIEFLSGPNPQKLRKELENEVDKIIKVRWDDSKKKSIKDE